MQSKVFIKNKRVRFDYELLDQFVAGIVLAGTEIKSLREGKASLNQSFCEFNERGELFVVNMQIDEYTHAGYSNHLPKASRKLLLQKRELQKLRKQVATTGLTIVPLNLFINERGWAKLTVALARGKKQYDKRETIKERDTKKDLDRLKKRFNN